MLVLRYEQRERERSEAWVIAMASGVGFMAYGDFVEQKQHFLGLQLQLSSCFLAYLIVASEEIWITDTCCYWMRASFAGGEFSLESVNRHV